MVFSPGLTGYSFALNRFLCLLITKFLKMTCPAFMVLREAPITATPRGSKKVRICSTVETIFFFSLTGKLWVTVSFAFWVL